MKRPGSIHRRYDGQIAVITGASSGIGRALALALADRGATVIGLARRKELLDELAAELSSKTSGSVTMVCDVADADAYRSVLAGVEADRGTIDVLVNNAGIDRPFPVLSSDDAAIRQVFDTNFFGTVTGTLAVLPGMIDRGSGTVLNVSSDVVRAPEARQGAYAASKAAVSTFTESAAHEVAHHGVHLHLLYPGWVPTAMALTDMADSGSSLPPKLVRRTEAGVATLVADRMGGPKVDINAAWLPLLAPISRTFAPITYQKSMRKFSPNN